MEAKAGLDYTFLTDSFTGMIFICLGYHIFADKGPGHQLEFVNFYSMLVREGHLLKRCIYQGGTAVEGCLFQSFDFWTLSMFKVLL